jgi:hypothetical protein
MYINKGSLKTGGASGIETASDEFNTLVLSTDTAETGVSITATKAGTEIILVSGEPLDQTVVQYGPFVMTTMDEIRQTIMDCESKFSTLADIVDCRMQSIVTDLRFLCRSNGNQRIRVGEELGQLDRSACSGQAVMDGCHDDGRYTAAFSIDVVIVIYVHYF